MYFLRLARWRACARALRERECRPVPPSSSSWDGGEWDVRMAGDIVGVTCPLSHPNSYASPAAPLRHLGTSAITAQMPHTLCIKALSNPSPPSSLSSPPLHCPASIILLLHLTALVLPLCFTILYASLYSAHIPSRIHPPALALTPPLDLSP